MSSKSDSTPRLSNYKDLTVAIRDKSKRIYRALGGLFVILALVLILLTKTDVGRSALARQIESKFNSKFQGSLKIEKLDGNLMRDLFASGISVSDSSGQKLIEVDSAIVRASWFNLAKQSFSLAEVEIINPSLTLRKTKSGTWNLAEALRQMQNSDDGGDLDFDSGSLKIKNGTLRTIDTFDKNNPWSNSTLHGLSALVNYSKGDSLSRISIQDFSIDDFREIEITDGLISLLVEQERVVLEKLSLRNQLSSFEFESGELEFGRSDSMGVVERLGVNNLHVLSNLSASDSKKLLVDLPLEGPVELDLTCSSESKILSCRDGQIKTRFSSIPFLASLDLRGFGQNSIEFAFATDSPILATEMLPESLVSYYDPEEFSQLLLRSKIRIEGSLKNDEGWRLKDSNFTLESKSEFEKALLTARIQRDSTDIPQLNASVDFENYNLSKLDALRNTKINGTISVLGKIVGSSLEGLQANAKLSRSIINGTSIDSASVSLGDGIRSRSLAGTIWADGGSLRYDALMSSAPTGQIQFNVISNDFEPGLIYEILDKNNTKSRNFGKLTSSVNFEGFRDENRMISGKGSLVLEDSKINLGERTLDLPQSTHNFNLARLNTQSLLGVEGDIVNGNITAVFEAEAIQNQIGYWSNGLSDFLNRLSNKRKYPRLERLAAVSSKPKIILADSLESRISGNLRIDQLGRILNSVHEDSSTTNLEFDISFEGSHFEIDGGIDTENLDLGFVSLNRGELDLRYKTDGNGFIEEPEHFSLIVNSEYLKLAKLPEMDLNLDLRGAGKSFKFSGQRLDVERQKADASFTVLSDRVVMDIDSFVFDSKFYDWRLNEEAQLVWYADGWDLNSFEISEYASLGSLDGEKKQSLNIDGGLFENLDESLILRASDLSLDYLSDILEPKNTFGGKINADLTLAKRMGNIGVEGKVMVDSLQLSGRDLGDLSASLGFDNSGSNRVFADGALIQTRPEADQVKDNDLRFKGYLPIQNTADNPIDLEVDINKIDLFFFDLMFYNELMDSGGFASGKGSIGGSYTRPIFNAQLECTGGEVTTKEYLVDYSLSGPFDVDEKGFVLKDVELIDNKGGSAIVSGRVDFNDYKYFSYGLDIDAREIQFINVAESDILPFYGFISGSGQLELSGVQSSTTLRGNSLTTTPDSEIFIPITEDELITDSTFILYADSTGAFPDLGRKRDYFIQDRPDTERSFVDGMDMYLNIDAPPGSQIHLVFDALLGDVVDATGSGQIQITSEGGEFLTHGTFLIDSGDYLFTASEFFSRKFNLLEGGSITWDGDPLNANLNIPASYKTRASLAGLAGYTAQQRVPLVIGMNLTGRVQSPLVDLSLSLDRSDRTWQGSIDGIESLINRPDLTTEYATSVLLTNTFLLTTNQRTDAISNVADEIIFNSVSHLVMSQLNRFLSEALNLDFNVGVEQRNDLEQYDLTYGFALRLADERLVIRGEGVYEALYQGGGTRSSINDGLQGAFILEYKLNPSVAVEFFYRREGDLLEYTSPIGTSYGAGLVYQNEFANWGEFRRRVRGTIDDAPISSQSESRNSN